MRYFPGSLRGQLVLLIVAALVIAQAFSFWLFVDERSLAVRAAQGLEAAGRAANVARLIDEAPPSLHESILRAAISPLVRFSIADRPEVDHLDHSDGGGIADRISALMGPDAPREIRVELHNLPATAPDMTGVPADMARMHRAMMGSALSAVEMRLSITLADGNWLNVSTRFQRPPLQWPWAQVVSFVTTAALILIAACWFILTRITGPLTRLSAAAEDFGRGEPGAPLVTRGPSEVRHLTEAFNRMQSRLTRFISDRTRLLASLSHDLKSPLTAMRVRAEMVEDGEDRERLIASIDEMRDMVEATLSFARGMAESEPSEALDVAAFLGQLRTDMAADFALDAGSGLRARIRPRAMRRALRNVIENALRYGESAAVTAQSVGDLIRITVTDHGPGIPETELERVFEPFYRIEKSRSRETGGTGLGLSIARTIVQAHGGTIALENRPGGGLAVRIDLPAA